MNAVDRHIILQQVRERGSILVYDRAYFAAECQMLVGEGVLTVRERAEHTDDPFGTYAVYALTEGETGHGDTSPTTGSGEEET